MFPSRDLLRGSAELLILALLRDRPMYGYEIIRELRERSEGYFAMEEGLLYPTLHRLEREGLLCAEWQLVDTAGAATTRSLSLALAALSSATAEGPPFRKNSSASSILLEVLDMLKPHQTSVESIYRRPAAVEGWTPPSSGRSWGAGRPPGRHDQIPAGVRPRKRPDGEGCSRDGRPDRGRPKTPKGASGEAPPFEARSHGSGAHLYLPTVFRAVPDRRLLSRSERPRIRLR